MSRRDIWAYNPDVCGGDLCVMDCSRCSKCEAAQEANGDFDDEPDDSQLEMGFNPYMGGYDFDC